MSSSLEVWVVLVVKVSRAMRRRVLGMMFSKQPDGDTEDLRKEFFVEDHGGLHHLVDSA